MSGLEVQQDDVVCSTGQMTLYRRGMKFKVDSIDNRVLVLWQTTEPVGNQQYGLEYTDV